MEYPDREVVCIVHDGSKDGKLNLSAIKSFSINVLVNNVGIGPMKELGQFSSTEIDETVTLNVLFPTHLTHSILAQLSRPSLILNVSSWAGIQPPPYLTVYAGTKAYNNAFSNSLSREVDDSMEIISLIVGSVHSAGNRAPITFFRPSSTVFAKHVLSIVGCGRKSVMPYWPHAVQTYLLSWLPGWLIDKAMKKAMEGPLKQHKRE
ncbi:unnamed protein product [Didymodactylos carnosus]|uniref:Uncharacterized protein n=1 Tax=Didymodactylos carnosus TaxID=1234261 RepID=A0A814U0J9_9BILA|nr:unnamed protein product [Didymodactylos carnosus]CAF1165400.1 unnamed protein product [Didymodactylos carnosus]CAF3627601.1 unnamed protein product [Didymodactylos carnosus]CAF3928952.1 unnamed protein product [Didymodactylos carnosus]